MNTNQEPDAPTAPTTPPNAGDGDKPDAQGVPEWGEPELAVMARMARALEEIEKQTIRVNADRIDAHSAVGTIALGECRFALAEYRAWKRKPKLRPESAPAAPDAQLREQVLELCYAIERLPASEQQTEISIKAAAIFAQMLPPAKAEVS